MALVNKLKPILDQPVWEWARFAPLTTVTLSGLCTSEDGDNRYMYYLNTSSFYRYDTVTDTYMQLASPVTVPTNAMSLRYSKYSGNRGRVLSQVSTTKLKIPYISGGSMLVGDNIVIRYGAGAGQERTITAVSTEVIEDNGLATSTSGAFVTDTTKRWKPNQWVGYNCRINYGTGTQLQRTILYNTVDTLWFADGNYQPYESFDNQGFNAGLNANNSNFIITSQEVTLDIPLIVNTNDTSRFIIQTGTIWLMSGIGSGGLFTWQMYDIANDIWLVKTTNPGLFAAAITTDFAVERTGARAGAFLSGTATSGTVRTLTDTSVSMVIDEFTNYQLRITGGMGMGQMQRIIANGTDYFEVAKKWDINPDNTSTYSVYADTDTIFFTGNANSSMLKYNVEADLWAQGNIYDYGVTCNITIQREGTLPFGIASGTRNNNAITSVVINNGGSNYRIGDVLTVSGDGGTNGKVYVETISPLGVILSVSLQRGGANYALTTGAATTGGTGTLATVNILSLGVNCLIQTSAFHQFKIGDIVTIKGCTDSLYNTTHTIIGVDGTTAAAPVTLEIATTAAANMAASFVQSATLIVDASENWDVNELVGKTVGVAAAGVNGAYAFRRIISNTATTITVTSSTTPATGTSRYIITEAEALGRDLQFPMTNQLASGYVTGGSTTTLIDSTKNWIPGCWNNYRIRIVAGTGLGNEFAITTNTSHTLTYATQTFTPDSTTRYQIMAVFGIATSGSLNVITDTTKNWKVNQWVGKRVRITAGTGQGQEGTVSSNTANTLTCTGFSSATDVTTQYTILGIPNRGLGNGLVWTFGLDKGRYMWSFRGNATSNFDRYDIVSDTWQYGNFISPQTELFSTGSQYAYDGGNRVYINHNATGRIYYFDLTTRELVNSGTIPYGNASTIIGNRMEIINGPDGLKFLYIMRQGAQEMWRTLLFW